MSKLTLKVRKVWFIICFSISFLSLSLLSVFSPSYPSANEIKIHFDGWGPEYDYWCDIDLVELHPVGWCGRHGYELQPPLSTLYIVYRLNNKVCSHSVPCDSQLMEY